MHGDLKPLNLLLHHGQIKLCDFGSSRLLRHDVAELAFTGTLPYMAPELLVMGRPALSRSGSAGAFLSSLHSLTRRAGHSLTRSASNQSLPGGMSGALASGGGTCETIGEYAPSPHSGLAELLAGEVAVAAPPGIAPPTLAAAVERRLEEAGVGPSGAPRLRRPPSWGTTATGCTGTPGGGVSVVSPGLTATAAAAASAAPFVGLSSLLGRSQGGSGAGDSSPAPSWMNTQGSAGSRGGAPTYAVDVYSFGVCVWEMCTRCFPWHALLEQGRVSELCRRVGRDGERLDPALCPAPLRLLVEACWRQAPSQRPTFEELSKLNLEELATSAAAMRELEQLAARRAAPRTPSRCTAADEAATTGTAAQPAAYRPPAEQHEHDQGLSPVVGSVESPV